MGGAFYIRKTQFPRRSGVGHINDPQAAPHAIGLVETFCVQEQSIYPIAYIDLAYCLGSFWSAEVYGSHRTSAAHEGIRRAIDNATSNGKAWANLQAGDFFECYRARGRDVPQRPG
jgi:hypothetical protein